MAFEGEHKIIPVKGITRAGADTLCDDGAMNEVIGLEYKDGSYVPYAEGKEELLLPQDTQMFRVHKTSSGNNVIVYAIDNLSYHSLFWMPEASFKSGEGADVENWNVILQDVDVKDITQSKNIIIIETSDKLIYYRFTGDGYEPISIGDINKDLPYLSLYVDYGGKIKIDNTERGSVLLAYSTSLEDNQLIARDLYKKGIAKLNEIGRLHGYVLALYAYKLVSGDYIYASSPILLAPPNDTLGIKYENQWNKTSYYISRMLSNATDSGFLKTTPYDKWEDTFLESEYASVDYNVDVFEKVDYSSSGKKGEVDIKNLPPAYAGTVRYYGAGGSYSSYQHLVASFLSNRLLLDISDNIDSKYDGLIESCCVFLSDQVPMYVMDSDDNVSVNEIQNPYNSADTLATGYKYKNYYYIERSADKIIEDIKNLKGFYKVYEIQFNDIVKSTGVEAKLEGKLGESLFFQDILPVSAFTDRRVIGGKSFVYNSRNHLYDYYDKLEYMNNLNAVIAIGGEGQYSDERKNQRRLAVIAEIDSIVEGKSIVVSDDFYIKADYLNGYVSYPNASAKRLWIFDKDRGCFKKFDLIASKAGGYAYAINAIEKPKSKADNYHSWFVISANRDEDDWNDMSNEIPLREGNTIIQQDNKIKVSQTYFVYSFGNANNYVIGNGEIIGMATLSIALSQDTFGQHPLLIFCTDGIYSMTVDTSGDGAYTNVPPPFSREVCINKNTICEIDGSVLFASSKGLMIASAQGVQEFLPTLNGTPKHVPTDDTSKGLGLDLYYKIINHPLSTELYDSISHDDFIQFLSNPDTVVSYVSNKNKVIVYNKSHMYSYWIDIPTRIVTKLPISIAFDNNNYPTEQYVLSSGEVFDFGYLSRDTDVQCLLQSRPIKNTYGMKSNLRVIARGYFNSSDANNYAVMLVLGSYDAINWQPIGVCQRPFAGGFNDLGCVTDRVSHKYVMVIITGKMSPDSHIDGIEMTINNKYNNKLK